MAFSDPTLTAIVDMLQQHPEALRIHKLIYAIYHHRWENDPQILLNAPILGLIQSLQQQAPTPAALQGQLIQVAKQLNKPERYLAISQIILGIVSPLYTSHNTPRETVSSPATPAIVPPTTASPTLVPLATVPPATVPPATLPPATQPPPHPRATEGMADLDYDHFEARLAIIKYANPLRAKILIFSAVDHPFGFSRQDWDSLQQWSLDQLIRQLVQSYPMASRLEQCLDQLATGFAELPPLEQMRQDAEAIVRAVRPLYEQTTGPATEDSQSLLTGFNATVDLMTLASAMGSPHPSSEVDDDADLTCQFFVRPQ
ncbi:hypothetical protein GS597_10355 [Synechococcales cyanobacterium C]|uniref:Uncharacterized protein n=1 Tax=Petrachloros mirabilis ULC683 TaxID=2781853 RepID=A0A8K1ZZY3_9CYAN|nr:hypothetical protein [Petrachloros mirabilis]NCJ06902.1 hypothetical protein [Petrachloros mirabilis ULC683]